jgi:hypothetical protein
MISFAQVLSFFDEFEKIAANVLTKKLSPAAKGFMERMTGYAHGASLPQAGTTRRLRQALTGTHAPELMTEMHGMGGMLSRGEHAAKQQAKQHFEGVLKSQGKVYQGAPGTEEALSQIAGHPRQITRTGTEVGAPIQPGTAVASPRARRQVGALAPVNPYSSTAMVGAQ